MITVTTAVHFTTSRAGRKRLHAFARPAAGTPCGRVPRVARLMALAIRFEGLLRDGTVGDLSELARLAGVTQPRMTQIMNLNHLAPAIQEELLFLAPVEAGRDTVHERMPQPVCAEMDWERQRDLWRQLFRVNRPKSTGSRPKARACCRPSASRLFADQ
ncbi:MAG: hypothetical protein JWP03_2620 [Phycisphaerales bacterium]|jgi:hypothetical protein|nr:hypothetical protein [Phycisphaerales bacterium]